MRSGDLKRSLFIVHASGYFGNSSVNHTCWFVLQGRWVTSLSKKLPGFLGENFKFSNVASSCGFLKVKRLFALQAGKGME